MSQSPSKRLVTEANLSGVLAGYDAALPQKVDQALGIALPDQVAEAVQSPAVQGAIASSAKDALKAATHPLAPWDAAVARRHLVPARIVFLGSSTTFGSNATNPARRYTELVLRRLQDAYPSGIAGWERPLASVGNGYPTLDSRPGVHGYVSAAGGQNSRNYVNTTNLPFIVWTKPAAVVHMIGSNDSIDVDPYKVPVAEYETLVAKAVDDIDDGVGTPVAHLLVHAFRRASVTLAHWATYLAALERVASTRPNVLVVDMSQEWEAMDHLGADPLDLLDTDGVHGTDQSHALMADLLAKALRVPQGAGQDSRLALLDTYTRASGPPGHAEFPYGRAWESMGAAAATVGGGRLTMTTAGTILVDSGLEDLELEAVINLQAGTLPGIVFRGTDDANRMGLFLNPGGALTTLYKTSGGATAAITSKVGALPAGPYFLQVRAVGDRVWCYVNGSKVIDYTLTSDEVSAFAGRTKVGVRTNTVHADLYWSSFRARRA